MLNMALLLRVVNKGEHVVVNQVAEEVTPSVEVGLDNCGTSQEPNFPDAFKPTLCFYKFLSLLLFYTALSD